MAVTAVEAPHTADPHRLPRHTRPLRYDVTLEPNLAAATFIGTTDIDVVTDEATDELVLNAIDLEIGTVTIDGAPAMVAFDDVHERVALRLVGGIAPGDHRVHVEFTGVLNDRLRGFYRSTYRDPDGVERVIATTQMQSTDCRRVFPCWDEPDFKAVFGIRLVIDHDLFAVSNGAEIATDRRADGKTEVTFADTMVMSSYLVAVVVGPLEATEWRDANGIPVRIVHPPGKGHLAGFGLDVATFSLAWFQDYYGIPYPSDKVDLIALPDFAAGAMENLGCITFRESLLLVNPATSTQSERQLVADVVAHELAHMWFGDLVTMRWWNGIWLNEAFATFMEIAACDAFAPDWERWTTFGLERSIAFETDALSSTRSVEFEVHSPADAEGMFDVLTYQKGGALLRMLEQYLGPERFRAGVSHYLRTNAYGNTETGDLWDAIEHTSGEPVRRIMDSWIWQPGFPLVSARLDRDQLVLSQRRFTFDAESADATLWAIPVRIRQDDKTVDVLLDGDELRLPAGDGPIIVNADGHGFFRVDYADELRARLDVDVVSSLSTLERFTLVDDAWSAVTAGAMDAAEFLDLAQRFEGERSFGVWQALAIGLRGVRRLLPDEGPAIGEFRRIVRDLAGPVLQSFGAPAPGEPDLTAKTRGLLLSVMAIQGADDHARNRATEVYEDWSRDPASVDAELAAAATSVVAAIGDADMYDRFVDVAESGATPQDQLRHLHLLAEFDDAELMQRTCEYAMSDAVKTQNAPFLLRACIANRRHGVLAWQFVQQHWADANDRLPRSTIGRMVDTVKLLDRPEQVAASRAFFSEHPIPQAAQTLEQILERQQVNAQVRANNADELTRSLGG
jgi:puromycin-sensitive aminopeptidase